MKRAIDVYFLRDTPPKGDGLCRNMCLHKKGNQRLCVPHTSLDRCLRKGDECGETPPQLGVRNSSRGPTLWGLVKSGLHYNVCCQAS